MTKLVRGTCALAVCLGLSLAATAEVPRVVPIARHGELTINGYVASPVVYDLDGDGRPELIACGAGAPLAFSAEGGNSYVKSWHGPASYQCTGVAAADLDGDGGADVVTVGDMLRIFDPRSLGGPVATIAMFAADVAIGNVDDDANPEIVVVSENATCVYDGVSLELQWSATGYGGYGVRIGDVDGDARREIVVTGSTGYVLDGGAEVQKWGYVGGFGNSFALGNVDGDTRDEIVFRSGSNVIVLHGDTFATTSWSGSSVGAVSVGDANDDGVNEVIVSNTSYPYLIEGRDPAGGAVLWKIFPGPYEDIPSVQVADLDNDGTPEVSWTATDDSLYVGHAGVSGYRWRSERFYGPHRSAGGDLDGDGDLEYAIGSFLGQAGSGPGGIEVFDAATHASQGRLQLPNAYSSYVFDVAIGQLDSDPSLEIAALIGYHDLQLVTWDGVTRQPEYASNGTYYYGRFAVANIDGDPVDEVIVGTSSSTAVLVLNGASNIIQKSLSTTDALLQIAVTDLTGDQAPELIIGTTGGLTVYDTTSWAVLGSQQVYSIESLAATPAGGGTVAVSANSTLRLFTGANLTAGFECPSVSTSHVAFARIADEERVLVATRTGLLSFYPLVSDGCPEVEEGPPGGQDIVGLDVLDLTGDGRDDLVIESNSSCTIALLGSSDELRGDIDGDEVVTADDVDTAVDSLFRLEPGSSTSADVNTDERLSVEDLFILINHEFAGGPLQP